MFHIFKRNIYNNFNHAYLGLSYKKCIYIPVNKKIKVSKIPKYLDVTLEELKNKKNINKMHRLVYKKKNI